MKIRHLLLATLLLSGMLRLEAQTPADSTLQRSMTLQRAYTPEVEEAKKEFFNPLANRTPRQFHPLDFVHNSYRLRLQAQPLLFAPSEHRMTPDYGSHHFYMRLFGGYPLRIGGSLGGGFRAGKHGTITLGVDHISQLLTGRQGLLSAAPANTTHDTEATIDYTQKLPDSERMMSLRLFGFSRAHSLYSHPLAAPAPLEEPITLPHAVTETPEMQSYYGGGLSLALSPAPISLLSTWQYSLAATIDYGSKEDWRTPPATEQWLEDLDGRVGALHAKVGGGLTYGTKIYDFRFGIDAAYELQRIEMAGEPGSQVQQIATVVPHLDYVTPAVRFRGGVKLQIPSIGSHSFVVAPDVSFRWQIHPSASILLAATGGTEMLTMSRLYATNRYAQAWSLDQSARSAKYDLSGGLELGPWYGFALELKGGYASYRDFYDYTTDIIDLPMPNGYEGEALAPVALFRLRQRGAVDHTYLSFGTRYVGPQGLAASLGLKYHNYDSRADSEETVEGELLGLPSIEILANATYSPLRDLTIALDFRGIGGVRMKEMLPPNLVSGDWANTFSLPFAPKLDLRVSYRLLDKLGLSLTLDNLLNQELQRWSYCYSPGIGIYAGLTLEL